MKFTLPACKQLIHKIVSFWVKPITCQPTFFLLCFVLINILDLFADGGFPLLGPFLKITFGFFVCYLLLMPVVIFPTAIRKVYKLFVLFIAIVLFVIDLFLLIVYSETFSTLHVDMLAAFVATNASEASEYLKTYLTFGRGSVICLSIFLLMLGAYYLRKLKLKVNLLGECVIFVILLVSVCVSVVEYKKLLLGNFYFLSQTESPNLIEYRQNPSVVASDDNPEYVVLLVGESFAKTHSSLYGYDKKTNPLLEQLVADSLLFVCKDATSACTNTIPATKSIMTSHIAEMNDSIDWYKCLTLIEVMQSIDYRTVWVSNHSRTGFFDNVGGCYAALCDESIFVNERNIAMHYDAALLPLIEEVMDSNGLKTFYVINLIGSHIYYKDRYPEDFSKFNSEDYIVSYSHLSQGNRQKMAEYDNTILYNDSVVYEIMKQFESKDAFVVYISDHGQDIFNSSNDYAGHAINGNAKSEAASIQIPFMVYTSPLFREKHPELQRRIEKSVNRPYRTDSIMYTIMDVAGVETVNGISYKHKSLFK